MSARIGKRVRRWTEVWAFLRIGALVGLLLAWAPVESSASGACQISLGFAFLRDTVNQAEGADTVGTCLEDIRYGAGGNSMQLTGNGLLAWSGSTNWTGFTDGETTWVNGPYGLEKRSNNEQFLWEEEAPRPEGAGFWMFESEPSGSFVAAENLGYGSFRYMVDGAPQLFIGMGYNPIYRALSDQQRAANYDRDFKILCEAGVNHITGWDADKGYEQDKFDEMTLDHAQKYGIGVIMPFYLPVEGDYGDEVFRQSLMDEAFLKVQRFKGHPALRIWGVGNEVLSGMPAEMRDAFAQFYVQLVDLFHSLDPDHPVIYREAEDLYVPFLSSYIDSSSDPRPWFLFGINVYSTRLDRILDQWPSYGINRAVIVSEFGAGPEWPGGRAIGYASMWRTIRAHPRYVLGGAPYVWTTLGPEPIDLKWGLMDDRGKPVDNTFDFLKASWLAEGRRSCPS
ncbi:MAG: glycoside hydrolase family 2 TIM barrel-domain containing protein [Dehalococcoidia bacterium]|nr:glycoside hydrolase family 2 TIM barrel-domain containing protein [Dehalococcoidia bacterium]